MKFRNYGSKKIMSIIREDETYIRKIIALNVQSTFLIVPHY